MDDVVNLTEVLRQEEDEVRKVDEVTTFTASSSRDANGTSRAISSPTRILQVPVAASTCLHVTGQLQSAVADGRAPVPIPLLQEPEAYGLRCIFGLTRTEDAPAKWIKAGVCLLTSTEV